MSLPFRILVFGLIGFASFAMPADSQSPPAADSNGIPVWPVRGKVFLLFVGGVNVTAQVGDEGVLLVNSGPAAWSDRLLATIKQRFDKPVRYIVNTSSDPEYTGANAGIANAMGVGRDLDGTKLTIFATQNTNNRMEGVAGKEDAIAQEGYPTFTFSRRKKKLYFNGEAIEVVPMAPGHTDGDVMVFFRGSDVISAGDLLVTDRYPFIDKHRGGNIAGLLDGLNRILDITVPEVWETGGTMVIPAHGRICNEADANEVRNAMTIIHDRIQTMAGKKMTLEQVRAAKPTLDYDGVFRSVPGWTATDFIEAVYHDLADPSSAPPAQAGTGK